MSEKIKALRKELSDLGLTEIFSPRYSPAFKKAAGEGSDAEENKLKELGAEVEESEEVNEKEPTEEVAPNAGEATLDNESEAEEETEEQAPAEVDDVASESETDADEAVSEVTALATEEGSEVDENQELLDTKLELEIVKARVRNDRIDDVRDFLKTKIKTLEDIAIVPQILERYPEWTMLNEKEPTKPFGMPIGDRGFGLTAEERRLKELGAEIGK